jgi:hypothetical protein
MKKRFGFVSNSSSSSFVCDICGQEESGYDMCLSEAGMVECVNGHTFCSDHLGSPDVQEKYKRDVIIKYIQEHVLEENEELPTGGELDDLIEEYLDEAIDYDDGLPAELCPVCSLQCILDRDMLRYLLLTRGDNTALAYRDICEEIRREYKNDPSMFYADIKGVNLNENS